MKKLLAIAAVSEALTGLALLVSPPLVIRLLFSAEIAGAGVVMSRMTGICLIALGVACWPGSAPGRALYGMFTYSMLVMLYLAYLGFGREWTGMLLWPAIVLHAGLTALLATAWFRKRQAQ